MTVGRVARGYLPGSSHEQEAALHQDSVHGGPLGAWRAKGDWQTEIWRDITGNGREVVIEFLRRMQGGTDLLCTVTASTLRLDAIGTGGTRFSACGCNRPKCGCPAVTP